MMRGRAARWCDDADGRMKMLCTGCTRRRIKCKMRRDTDTKGKTAVDVEWWMVNGEWWMLDAVSKCVR